MTINQNNFEAYLLDYLEGNLDPLLTADLMAFLAENPEYESYIPEYDTRMALNGKHEYHLKDRLKKDFADVSEITLGNFDEFCIASCEQLLDQAGRKRLSDFLAKHPEKKKEFDLYAKLKLQPDISVVFANKALLKKSTPVARNSRLFYFAAGIAASLALLFVVISKKPAESAFTQAPVKEQVMAPAFHADLPSTNEESAKQQTNSDHAPIENYRKATPAVADLPVTRETSDEAVVLHPIESVGAQGMLTVSPVPPVDFSRMAVTLQSETNLQDIAAVDLHSSEKNAGLLGSLISRMDFWKTAEKAIQGFNYLTEANLDIDKTLDDNGKLSAILLNTESYRISGNKIK